MNNYRITIQYDGSRYAGWQTQENAVTIQQMINDALELILKEKVKVNGSGRTDSGVHALGQVGNFRTEAELDLYKFKYQMNSVLPGDISIIKAEKAGDDFHSRYDAKKRSYVYLITAFKSPFLKNYSWYLNKEIDLDAMRSISAYFKGKKDYTAFCRKASETENKICEVYNIQWKRTSGITIFLIEADRFLHGMVRTILGTSFEALKKQDPAGYIKAVFEKKERSEAGEAVPAKGLFLYKVKYEN